MAADEMTIASPERVLALSELSSVMFECDPGSTYNLAREINDLSSSGIEVRVGDQSDEAYRQPEKIIEVYKQLELVNDSIDDLRDTQTPHLLGYLATAPYNWLARRKAIDKEHYDQQDEIRHAMLYGPTASDSQAWHDQRGRAPALLSITAAHQLASVGQLTNETEAYATMSGPLDKSIFDYRFPENMQHIGGMDLSDALRMSETKHSGVKNDIADIKTMKRLTKLDDFIHSPNSENFIDIAKYCTDSLGIRSRMHDMGENMEAHLERLFLQGVDLDGENVISIGSGTALSVLEVMQQLKITTGTCPTAILVDQDPISLAAAAQLAKKMGLEDKIEIHCERLFSKTGIPLKLEKVLAGRQVILSEDAGLREYLPVRLYKSLGAELWASLKPGGMMATANMNVNRPQGRFLHGGMGWQPAVQMRKMADCVSLHEAIGIDRSQLMAQVTHDGLYTQYYSVK